MHIPDVDACSDSVELLEHEVRGEEGQEDDSQLLVCSLSPYKCQVSYALQEWPQSPLPTQTTPPAQPKPAVLTKRKLSGTETRPVVKRARPSGPLAVHDVASALQSIASSLQESEEHGTEFSTPQRRTKAIKAVATDHSLMRDERIKAMRLFRKDIASADAYLAIEDDDMRTCYLKEELAEF
jgi:hypothetical protein